MPYQDSSGVQPSAVLLVFGVVALAWALLGPVGVLLLAGAWLALGHLR